MDATTVRGREALRQAREALDAVEQATGHRFVAFSDETPADVDGFISSQDVIVSLYEVKARDMSSEELSGRYNWEWLLTWDKLLRAATLSKSLHLPFTAVLYCTKDGVAFVKTLWDAQWNLRANIRVQQTNTQKTVNGGTASRANAFIDMRDAKRFKIRQGIDES